MTIKQIFIWQKWNWDNKFNSFTKVYSELYLEFHIDRDIDKHFSKKILIQQRTKQVAETCSRFWSKYLIFFSVDIFKTFSHDLFWNFFIRNAAWLMLLQLF